VFLQTLGSEDFRRQLRAAQTAQKRSGRNGPRRKSPEP